MCNMVFGDALYIDDIFKMIGGTRFFFFRRGLILFSDIFRWLFNQTLFDLSETLLMGIRVTPVDRKFKEDQFDICCLDTRSFVILV